MTSERPILQLGHPTLRQVAQPVKSTADAQVQQLIDDLILTVQAASGVGLAAPQVGQSLQLLVVASRPNPRYPHAPVMEPTALINPRLIAHSEDTVKGWEGCLSIPGIRGLVPRYREVEVEYLDPWGAVQRVIWTDFVARIFQHESDHLAGKVFLDRVESTADLMTEQEYQTRVLAEGSGAGS
ncbi:MAG: peptide deformylase [Cyanobacteria bacterium Co-bin13]|nr:peptide deformylase [Cyanobacteria bacterium Co-bin13]